MNWQFSAHSDAFRETSNALVQPYQPAMFFLVADEAAASRPI
jgi:hypothetical protein